MLVTRGQFCIQTLSSCEWSCLSLEIFSKLMEGTSALCERQDWFVPSLSIVRVYMRVSPLHVILTHSVQESKVEQCFLPSVWGMSLTIMVHIEEDNEKMDRVCPSGFPHQHPYCIHWPEMENVAFSYENFYFCKEIWKVAVFPLKSIYLNWGIWICWVKSFLRRNSSL